MALKFKVLKKQGFTDLTICKRVYYEAKVFQKTIVF